MAEAVQVWECSKCGIRYHSPVAIESVTCHNPNCIRKGKEMAFIDGRPPKWLAEREAKTARPKVRRVVDMGQLFETLGKNE